MTNIWFTSDQHFGHANIIKYCARPFDSVHEMNAVITERHNALVKPKDQVYHLGDFAFANHARYLARLNGQHHLILGNHDRPGRLQDAPFLSQNSTLLLRSTPVLLWLSHYAHRVWPQSHYGTIHLYGHSHGKLPGVGRSMDVGVDTTNFRPYNLDEIIAIFPTRAGKKGSLNVSDTD